jgi:glycosyltransferase involved in cell wall biosynthesis
MIHIAIIGGKINSGGKKNLIMEYYRHIDRSLMQFDFICDADSEAIPEDEIKSLGGRIYKIAPYQHIFKNMFDMRKIFNKNHYYVVHAYNSTMNLFPMFVAKCCGIPVRITESLSMANKQDKKTILKVLLRPMSKWFANYYISCGEDCGRWQFGDDFFGKGNVDVFKTVINTEFNSYDPVLRKETREKYGWNDNIVIGHIGRFTMQKNSVYLIELFAEIVKQEPRAILCLIGDGELREAMKAKAIELHVEEKIFYLGRREDIQQFYNAMDCFVLPSLYEGLPVVGLEAESCGLPMFFSSKITREANACDLGHFIDLNKSKIQWASEIILTCKKNMPVRCSRAKDVATAGFDSSYEAIRLQNYYINAKEEQIGIKS